MKEEVSFDGKKVTIVGTAHVSEESLEEVESVIEDCSPDLVGVELDESRLESLRNKSGWRDMDLSEAIKDGKGGMLFANLMLSIYQRRLGLEKGIEPGAEMLAALDSAEDKGIDTALLDRDIGVTLDRLRSELSFWQKYKLAVSLVLGSKEEFDVEEVKQPKILDELIEELGEELPAFKKVLLEERNHYMAEKLREKDFSHAVVVVGAAHVEGLKKELEEPSEQVSSMKTGGWPVLKIVKYGFPALVLGVIGFTLIFNQCKFREVATIWIGFNAALAGLGAILARSHALTVSGSLIAAPFTSLNPGIGAGYVAAYMEAKFYPPTVEELEELPYITKYRELWSNQAGRILLAFVLVTIGSAIATFIGTFAGIEAAAGAC